MVTQNEQFEINSKLLFQSLGSAKKMVLSTCLEGDVTSRMMSIIKTTIQTADF